MFSVTVNSPVGQEVIITGFCKFVIPDTLVIFNDSYYDTIINGLAKNRVTDYIVVGYTPPTPAPVFDFGTYLVGRGPVSDYDFESVNTGGILIPDGNPHVLDLSGIVPTGAKFAWLSLLLVNGTAPSATAFFSFAVEDGFPPLNSLAAVVWDPDFYGNADGFVKLNSSRQIGYFYAEMGSTDSALEVTVRGWYL